MMIRLTAMILLTSSLVCRDTAKSATSGQATDTAGAVVGPDTVASSFTSRVAQTPKDSLGSLLKRLSAVRGEYRRVPPHDAWEFHGDKTLFLAIAQFGDSAVARLADCLDRETPSSTLLGKRRVPLGVICYEALRHTAYVEKPSDDEPWVGDVSPTATVSQLKRAKAAWVRAIREHEYNLL